MSRSTEPARAVLVTYSGFSAGFSSGLAAEAGCSSGAAVASVSDWSNVTRYGHVTLAMLIDIRRQIAFVVHEDISHNRYLWISVEIRSHLDPITGHSSLTLP